MHGPCVDDNDGPEAILLPAIALGVEVELVAARLGIVIRVSDAAVAAHAAQCPGWQFNNTFLCSSFSLKTYLSFGLVRRLVVQTCHRIKMESRAVFQAKTQANFFFY